MSLRVVNDTSSILRLVYLIMFVLNFGEMWFLKLMLEKDFLAIPILSNCNEVNYDNKPDRTNTLSLSY